METDDGFKQILEALDRNELTDNTLVIFTSDNGCSRKPAKTEQLEQLGHYPSCLLYTSPSPRDRTRSRMPSSA